jgi:hypothetical protein
MTLSEIEEEIKDCIHDVDSMRLLKKLQRARKWLH